MAERYSMLPTEILSRASTQDLMIFSNANIIRVRIDKQNRGESTADTYSKDELSKIWEQTKGKDGS